MSMLPAWLIADPILCHVALAADPDVTGSKVRR
jgi:hypothetical protein